MADRRISYSVVIFVWVLANCLIDILLNTFYVKTTPTLYVYYYALNTLILPVEIGRESSHIEMHEVSRNSNVMNWGIIVLSVLKYTMLVSWLDNIFYHIHYLLQPIQEKFRQIQATLKCMYACILWLI